MKFNCAVKNVGYKNGLLFNIYIYITKNLENLFFI